jgi:putative nucleotidyltransferase with HDIG domain
MIKKIKIQQLKPGVFVHDFNCGWLHHPFLADRRRLKSERDIEKILKYGIRDLYIDTDKGLDVDDAPTKQEAEQEIQLELNQLPASSIGSNNRRTCKGDFARAKELIAEVKETTKRLMHDVRLGKRTEIKQVEGIVERMTDSVLRNQDALVSLLRIKNVDEYTYLHSMAVSALCISFAQCLGFDTEKIKQIGIGGLLHDIGKMRVPREILNKPGPLTEKEFVIMKQHVTYGESIVQHGNLDVRCICVISHHHERLDGSGYPEGLKGEQISLFGQMAAIVDIYDALSSERCYKKAMSPTDALKKVYEWGRSYLNRELAEKFIAHLGIYPIGTLVRLGNRFVGVVVAHGEKDLLHPVVRAVYDIRKGTLIDPIDFDLARQFSAGNFHEIVSCESGDKWKIEAADYLY